MNVHDLVSFGMRYQRNNGKEGQSSITTMALTPMTGHLSSTRTILLSSCLGLSTRFDFNMFSHESNLNFGLEYYMDPNTLIRTSIDIESGFSHVYLEKKLNHIRWGASLGFPTRYTTTTTTTTCSSTTSLIDEGGSPIFGFHIMYQPS
jgi:hypothetical protein